MKSSQIEIDGVKYERPRKNLLGLAIIEYVIWFAIGFLIVLAFIGMNMQSATSYDPETEEFIYPPVDYSQPGYMITYSLMFLCWFIFGPIFAYLGVITRPLLMRPANIKKWNEIRNRKLMPYQAPQHKLFCTDCGKTIPMRCKNMSLLFCCC